jgi:hypothetical protein
LLPLSRDDRVGERAVTAEVVALDSARNLGSVVEFGADIPAEDVED